MQTKLLSTEWEIQLCQLCLYKSGLIVFKYQMRLLFLFRWREQTGRSSLFPETYKAVCFLLFFIKILSMKYIAANEKPKCTCPH